jgi:hypothetical protein
MSIRRQKSQTKIQAVPEMPFLFMAMRRIYNRRSRICAGFPTAIVPAGTSQSTTAFAPISE